jgi:hypothetical protein
MPDDAKEPTPPRKVGGLDPGVLFAQALSSPEAASRAWAPPSVEELQRALPQYQSVAMAALAAPLGIGEDLVRVSLARLLREFREAIHTEVLLTVEDPPEGPDDLAYLMGLSQR